MPPLHHRKGKTARTRSIYFLIHNCSTNYVALSMIVIMSHCLHQGWPNILTEGPNSQLPGHRRAGYSAIYVIYAKWVIKMYCSTIITTKLHHFFHLFIALLRQTSQQETGSSQCCCTAVYSRKRGACKKCTSYLAGQIKLVGARMRPACRSLATAGLTTHTQKSQ